MGAFCAGTRRDGTNCERRVLRPGERCGQCRGPRRHQRRTTTVTADTAAVTATEPFDVNRARDRPRCGGPQCTDRTQLAGVDVLVDDGNEQALGKVCHSCATSLGDVDSRIGVTYRFAPRPPGRFRAGDAVELPGGHQTLVVATTNDGAVRVAGPTGGNLTMPPSQLARPYRHHPDAAQLLTSRATPTVVRRVAEDTGNDPDVLARVCQTPSGNVEPAVTLQPTGGTV